MAVITDTHPYTYYNNSMQSQISFTLFCTKINTNETSRKQHKQNGKINKKILITNKLTRKKN